MKKFFLVFCSSLLIVSLAAPSGAVFASEVMEEQDSLAAEAIDAVSESDLEQRAEQVPASSEKEEITTTPIAAPSQDIEPPQKVDIVQSPAPTLIESPFLITAYKATGAHMHVVQLYNKASSMQSLEGFVLQYSTENNDYRVALPSGWVMPRSYMALAWTGESANADSEFAFDNISQAESLRAITLQGDGMAPLVVDVPLGYGGELLHRYKSEAGNYTTNTTFSVGEPAVVGGGLYVLPGAPTLQVLEILVNPHDCTYGTEADDCYDYIKVRNTGDQPLDLSQYRLRSGYSNVASSATNTTYFNDILEAQETRTLLRGKDGKRISFTANNGTVWMEDVHGFTSFDLNVPPYIDSDKAAQVGRSWAYNSETDAWQWATPTPYKAENDFRIIEFGKGGGSVATKELKPCRDDQYRSEETNRCRSIVSANVLKPCRDGQYRSEETNRCRSIASAAASVLKPCADDQFRSPETNRCRKIASSEDIALVDCGEGRERNPETHRCRNVRRTVPPVADFAVEPVKEAASVFVGWWVLGVIVAAAVGYAGWEWREEIGRAVRKVFRVGRSAE